MKRFKQISFTRSRYQTGRQTFIRSPLSHILGRKNLTIVTLK